MLFPASRVTPEGICADERILQVYTGNGKGKTTATIGLAICVAGAGLRVFFAQFVKGVKYSEIRSLERFPECITIRQNGRGCFTGRKVQAEDVQAAREGFAEVKKALHRVITTW